MTRPKVRPKANLKNYWIYFVLIIISLILIWFEDLIPSSWSFLAIFVLIFVIAKSMEYGLNKYKEETKVPQYADDPEEETEYSRNEIILIVFIFILFVIIIGYLGKTITGIAYNIYGLPKFFLTLIFSSFILSYLLFTFTAKFLPFLRSERKKDIPFVTIIYFKIVLLASWFLLNQMISNNFLITSCNSKIYSFKLKKSNSIKMNDYNESRFFHPTEAELRELKDCDSVQIEIKRILNLFDYISNFNCADK